MKKGLGLRVYQFQGDLDFVGASGRPLDADLMPGLSHAAGWGVPDAVPFELPEFLLLDCIHMLAGGEFVLLSDAARKVLSPLFAGCGEFLPVRVLGHSYWWFNCLVTHDCLDRSARVADFLTPSRFFDASPLWPFDGVAAAVAPVVFRLPQVPVGEMFVKDSVPHAVEAHGLTGFDLREVWPAQGIASGAVSEREDIDPPTRQRLIAAKRAEMARRLPVRV